MAQVRRSCWFGGPICAKWAVWVEHQKAEGAFERLRAVRQDVHERFIGGCGLLPDEGERSRLLRELGQGAEGAFLRLRALLPKSDEPFL